MGHCLAAAVRFLLVQWGGADGELAVGGERHPRHWRPQFACRLEAGVGAESRSFGKMRSQLDCQRGSPDTRRSAEMTPRASRVRRVLSRRDELEPSLCVTDLRSPKVLRWPRDLLGARKASFGHSDRQIPSRFLRWCLAPDQDRVEPPVAHRRELVSHSRGSTGHGLGFCTHSGNTPRPQGSARRGKSQAPKVSESGRITGLSCTLLQLLVHLAGGRERCGSARRENSGSPAEPLGDGFPRPRANRSEVRCSRCESPRVGPRCLSKQWQERRRVLS